MILSRPNSINQQNRNEKKALHEQCCTSIKLDYIGVVVIIHHHIHHVVVIVVAITVLARRLLFFLINPVLFAFLIYLTQSYDAYTTFFGNNLSCNYLHKTAWLVNIDTWLKLVRRMNYKIWKVKK